LIGIAMQFLIFRRMEGQDLRQTLVTLGLSIIFSDLMVWVWGGNAIQIDTPDYLAGPVPTPIVVALKSSGEAVFLQYPLGRLVIFAASALIGIAMWLALHRTRIGVMIRAGVDDRDMLSVLGYRVQLLFVMVFAFGAGLAGMAGIVGGTFQSISLGEDSHFLLASLVVVIVGGMGSIPGAALGALIIGLSEQFGLVYFQNYATMLSFLIMVLVLAIRPQGLLGRR
jgi:branched-chain amino acid transport system permease protein